MLYFKGHRLFSDLKSVFSGQTGEIERFRGYFMPKAVRLRSNMILVLNINGFKTVFVNVRLLGYSLSKRLN